MAVVNDVGKIITNITENDKKVSRELILQAVQRTLSESKMTMCAYDVEFVVSVIEKSLYLDITMGDYQRVYSINHQDDDDFKMHVIRSVDQDLVENVEFCPFCHDRFIKRKEKCAGISQLVKDVEARFGKDLAPKILKELDKDGNNSLYIHLYRKHVQTNHQDVLGIVYALWPEVPKTPDKPKLHIVWKSVILTLISFIVMSIMFKLINSNNSWSLSLIMGIAETLVITCILTPMKYFWFEKPGKADDDKYFYD